jgi:hypothetical protein
MRWGNGVHDSAAGEEKIYCVNLPFAERLAYVWADKLFETLRIVRL